MAATFNWAEDNGAATGSPAHGTTRSGFPSDTHYPTELNWKNVDDNTENGGTAYSSSPITAGNNSYQKNLYGVFTTGTFNNILSGLFAHITTSFGSNLTLMGVPACSTSGGPYTYVTPSTSSDSGLTTNMTTAIAISSGVAVWFGPTGPEATGKAATQATGANQYTNWLTTQLQTAVGAAAGDTSSITMELEYSEN